MTPTTRSNRPIAIIAAILAVVMMASNLHASQPNDLGHQLPTATFESYGMLTDRVVFYLGFPIAVMTIDGGDGIYCYGADGDPELFNRCAHVAIGATVWVEGIAEPVVDADGEPDYATWRRTATNIRHIDEIPIPPRP